MYIHTNYMCIHIYIYIYIHTYTHIYTHVHIYIHYGKTPRTQFAQPAVKSSIWKKGRARDLSFRRAF